VNGDQQVGSVEVQIAAGGVAVVALLGEHDLNSRRALRATFDKAAASGDLIVDLSRCTFADSAIISQLLIAERTLAGHGARCELVVSRETGYVRRLLEVSGISEVFRTHGSRDEALASLAAPRAA
jgi:anti-anti-sigma factor